MPRKSIIFAIVLFLIGIAFAIPWDTELNFTSSRGDASLSIGVAEDATDGYDYGIDTAIPFAPPSGPYAFSYIDDPDYPEITMLSNDLRADDLDPKTWIIDFQRGRSDLEFYWSEEDILMLSSIGDIYVGFAYIDSLVHDWTKIDSISPTSMSYPIGKRLHFKFVPLDIGPSAPYVASLTPYDREINVALDAPIEIEIRDSDNDLVESSISLTVDGRDITDFASISSITGGYSIEYTPAEDWEEDTRFNCNIYAEDEESHSLDYNFCFTTTTGSISPEWIMLIQPWTTTGSDTSTSDLYLGVDPSATDNIDPDFDDVFPLSPPGIFYAFFDFFDPDLPDVSMLSTDIRRSGRTNYWTVFLDNTSSSSGIKWNSDAIPDGFVAEIGQGVSPDDVETWHDMHSVENLSLLSGVATIKITDSEPEPDSIAPSLLSVIPSIGETEVDIEAGLFINLSDDVTGIDESSITLTVNGIDITDDADIEVDGFMAAISYRPEEGFEPETEIEWELHCCDLAASPNCADYSGNFTTDIVIVTMWNDTITIETSPVDDTDYSMELIFGADSNATEGFDPLYDVQAPPPPPGFQTYGYFTIEDDMLGQLFADIRNAATATVLWEAVMTNIDTSRASYTINWNDIGLPADGDFKIGYGELGATPDTWLDMHTETEMSMYQDGSIFISYNRNPIHIISGEVLLSDEPASLEGSTVRIMEMPIYSAETDEEGAYELPEVPEGEWTFIVSHEGYVSDTVVHTVGSDTTFNFELEPSVETYDIYGTIHLDPEDELAGTELSLDGEIFTETDSMGNYIFTGLEMGEYELLIERDGYGPVHTTISIVDENVEYNDTLYETGATIVISVSLEDPLDDPEGTTIYMLGYELITDTLGYVIIDDVVAGEYFIQIEREYYETIGDTVVFGEEDDTLYYDMAKFKATVSGTVTSSIGTDMSGIDVNVGDDVGTTDGDGFYMVEDVMYGERIVSASKAGYETYNHNLAVDSEEVTHDFEMTYSGSTTNPPTNFRIVNGLHGRIGFAWSAPEGEATPTNYRLYQARIIGDDEMLVELPSWVNHYIMREAMPGSYYVKAVYGSEESEGTGSLFGYAGDDDDQPGILFVDYDDGAELAEDGTEDEAEWIQSNISSRYYIISDRTEQNESLEEYDLLQYRVIWIVTGIDDETDELLSESDASKLRSYMGGGGSIYWEGADVGYDYGRGTGIRRELFNLFGVAYGEDGRSRSAGNVQNLTGIADFFEEGQVNLGYGYQTPPDTRVDEFTVSTGTPIMRSQDDPSPISTNIRMVANYSEELEYRSVISSVYLGGMHDTNWRMHHRWMVFAWIWNFLSYEDTQISSIQTNPDTKPNNIELVKAYPNPFNASTMIEFELEKPGYAKLELFSTDGRRIMDIFEGECKAIQNSIRLDGEGLESGVYLVKLTHENGSYAKRISLIK
ncbi:MAG: carboxypeptidase regulatory-like domain-containing protein [Candidatus Zixiibacteriota bacterium]